VRVKLPAGNRRIKIERIASENRSRAPGWRFLLGNRIKDRQ